MSRPPWLRIIAVLIGLTQGTLFPVLAQNAILEGEVRDRDGVPLAGVNIALMETSRGGATNSEGTYQILGIPPGAYTVQFSMIGFKTFQQEIRVAPGGRHTLDALLEEVVLESSGVVVTAARREQRAIDVPVSLSLLSPRELERRNVTSLDQALRTLSGVQVKGNDVSIRGSSGFSYNVGSRVLLMLDGIPLLSPDSEGMPFEALPFAQVDRIEVIKGPGSALYGSGALGGIINVITRDFPDTPETFFRNFGGAYEPVRYRVWREKWEGSNILRPYVGGVFSHSRKLGESFGFWTNLYMQHDAGYLELSEKTSVQQFTKLGWFPSPSFRANVLLGWLWRVKDDYLFWNGIDDALTPGTLFGSNGLATTDNVSSQFSFIPDITHVISDRAFYSLKARVFGLHLRPLDETGNPRSVSTQGTYGFRYGAEWQLNFSPVQDRHLTAGLTFDSNWARSSFFGIEEGQERASAFIQPEIAAFAQWEQSLFGGPALVAGLRYDTYFISEAESVTRLSPKINLSYAFSNRLTARAAWGEGFRVPSLAERFASSEDFFVIPNLGILPEESVSYEVGIRSILAERGRSNLQLDIAAFYNTYENLIESSVNEEVGRLQFINLPRARIQGFETTADAWLMEGRYQFRVGYTFLETQDLERNEPLTFRSRHLLNLTADINPWSGLEMGADFRLASEPVRANTEFSLIVKDAEWVADTRVLDLRLAWSWDGYKLGVLVGNALEYYYLSRAALLAPPRQYTIQFQARL